MDPLGHQVLAHPGFAQDQHRGVGGRQVVYGLEHVLGLAADGHHAVVHEDLFRINGGYLALVVIHQGALFGYLFF